MIHLVFTALFAARVAYLGAELADLRGKLRAAGHLAHRKGANVSATAIEFDAADHHLDILFLEAGGRAVFARFHALVTGFYAVFVVFVRHNRRG